MPESTRHRRVRRAAPLAAAVLLSLLLAGAGPVPPGVDPDEFLIAARKIKCDCGCHPQSVYDCTCGRAEEMRQEVAAEVRRLQTGEAVIAAYVERHGDQILLAPTAGGFNLVAWLGPGALIAAAAAGMVLLLRRWSRNGRLEDQEEEAGDASRAASGADDRRLLARLESELEEYDR